MYYSSLYLYIVCSTPEESVAGNDACIHSPNDDNVDDHILTNNKTMHAMHCTEYYN